MESCAKWINGYFQAGAPHDNQMKINSSISNFGFIFSI